MRKNTYLKLKKKRKRLRRQGKKKHDRLWAYFKGMVRDKSKADKVSDEFVDICSKANGVTEELKKIGYYDADLKVKKKGILVGKSK